MHQHPVFIREAEVKLDLKYFGCREPKTSSLHQQFNFSYFKVLLMSLLAKHPPPIKKIQLKIIFFLTYK